MGLFRPKEEGLLSRIEKVTARLAEITRQIETKKRNVGEARETFQARLAELAMDDSETNQQSVANSKKAIERLEDGLKDLQQMEAHLQAEKIKLVKESYRAFLRELPMALTGTLGTYNALVDKAVGLLGELKKVHGELSACGAALNAVMQKRAEAVSALAPEAVDPMPDLEIGMGLLSKAPVPFRYAFTPIDNVRAFLGELLAYEERVESFQKFQVANPHFGEKPPAENIAGIGSVGTPGGFKGRFYDGRDISEVR